MMRMGTQYKNGFTIVELLIVIVVIAILAAITIVAFNGIQQRSRDSSRGSAVTTLQKALALYHADHGEYPDACNSFTTGCNTTLLSSYLVPEYIASIPRDPTSGRSIDYVISGTAQGYGIYARYEAKNPCKHLGGTNPNTGWWGSSVPVCS